MTSDDLFAHGAALGFCAGLFHPAFDRNQLLRPREEGLSSIWPLPVADAAGSEDLQAVLDVLSHPAEATLAAIEADHAALFVGPGEAVPMWESVWLTEERLLYGACTADVRAAFAQAGFVIPGDLRQPEDHLAFELSFLAALLVRAGQALDEGRDDQAKALLLVARSFHRNHTALWARDCLGEIGRAAETPFLRGIASLCADALKGLEALAGG